MAQLTILISFFLLFLSGQNMALEKSQEETKKKNYYSLILRPFFPKELQKAYTHSMLQNNRLRVNKSIKNPLVDVWRYQYKPKDGDLISSKEPIATKKKFWKHPDEARIISLTLFGNNEIYLKGMLNFLKSIDYINEVNGFSDTNWGFKSFTVRVYVAKRNPLRVEELGDLKNATDDKFIAEALESGCEIAYVDNGLEAVGKDATFWRFMVAGEKMPKDQKIRYLVRDADWWVSAAELFSVLEWIDSGLPFHRMQLFSICVGPLTASIFGGSHSGEGSMSDIKDRIFYYPYRNEYGDDEMFTRDYIWKIVKGLGVLTHIGRRSWEHKIANPYKNSCEEPTQFYCDKINSKSICIDKTLPGKLVFPERLIGLRKPLEQVQKKYPKYFLLNGSSSRIERSLEVF